MDKRTIAALIAESKQVETDELLACLADITEMVKAAEGSSPIVLEKTLNLMLTTLINCLNN